VIECTETHIGRFENGQLVENWVDTNFVQRMMEAMGAMGQGAPAATTATTTP
jgi:hypothetical protein